MRRSHRVDKITEEQREELTRLGAIPNITGGRRFPGAPDAGIGRR